MLIKKRIPILFIIYKADRSELTHSIAWEKQTCGCNPLFDYDNIALLRPVELLLIYTSLSRMQIKSVTLEGKP